MKTAKLIWWAILFLGLCLAGLPGSEACTVFCDSEGGTVFAGRSFDIPDNSDLGMLFVPASGTAHGWVCCGRTSWPWADGMNDQGFFVAVADVPTPRPTVSHTLPPNLETFIRGLLANNATVEEAIAWCRKQPTPRLGGWLKRWTIGDNEHPFFERDTFDTPQHILMADHTGNSAVCEWVRGRLKVIRKTGRYQLMTNFLLSAPELGDYPCPRFLTDTNILSASPKPSLETCVAVLKATAAGNTKYSLVCDLVRGEMTVYLRRQFAQPKMICLKDELRKGRHLVNLDEWFGVPHPPTLALPEVTSTSAISATDILSRALEARGGEEAAARLYSIHAKGTFQWNLGCFAESPVEFFAARPGKMRLVIDQKSSLGVDLGRYDSGFDGRMGWEAPAGAAAQRAKGKWLEQFREDAEFFAWYTDPKNYQSYKCLGEASFNGKRCYAVELVAESGRKEMQYYEVTNFLLAGVMGMVETSVGPTLEKTSFGDYREVAGFQFPLRQDWESEWGKGGVQYDSVEVNEVKPSAFVRTGRL